MPRERLNPKPLLYELQKKSCSVYQLNVYSGKVPNKTLLKTLKNQRPDGDPILDKKSYKWGLIGKTWRLLPGEYTQLKKKYKR